MAALDYSDYSIGWIAVMGVDSTAAVAAEVG